MTFLTVKQVAAQLQLSPSKVYELLRGRLPRHKFGGAVRVAQDDLKSVILWVFRNGTREFKLELLGELGFMRDTDEEKRRRRKAKEKKDQG